MIVLVGQLMHLEDKKIMRQSPTSVNKILLWQLCLMENSTQSWNNDLVSVHIPIHQPTVRIHTLSPSSNSCFSMWWV